MHCFCHADAGMEMSAFMQASTRPNRERIIGARFSLPIDPEPLLLRITGRNGIGEEG
jgi:hypothetical protein